MFLGQLDHREIRSLASFKKLMILCPHGKSLLFIIINFFIIIDIIIIIIIIIITVVVMITTRF